MEPQLADAAVMACQFCRAVVPAHAWFCPGCGAPVVSAEKRRAAAGRRPNVPGYTVFAPLGWGGSSIVYRARQDNLGRDVAVKLIREEIDDVAAWRRFEREARIIASLSGHPHVVTIYDVGRTATGQPFLVTELLDRGSVGDVLTRRGALDTQSAVAVGRAMADALRAAHARGILHRDLKPGNVLVGSRGQIKLADFGVARLMAGHTQTTTASIAFTPEHAAPEVLHGEDEGPASDVYGLASTVVTALLGRSPFARRPDERIEAMMWRKMVEPPPPLPASVPTTLAALMRRCLATSPADRPSLDEVLAELAKIDVSGAVLGPAADVATLRHAPSPVAAAAELAPTVRGGLASTAVLPPPPAGSVGEDGPRAGVAVGPAAADGSGPLGPIGRRGPRRSHRAWRVTTIGVAGVALAAGVGAILVAQMSGGGTASPTTPAPATIARTSPTTEPAATTTAAPVRTAAPTTTALATSVATTALPTTVATTTTSRPTTSAAPSTLASSATATSVAPATSTPPAAAPVVTAGTSTTVRTTVESPDVGPGTLDEAAAIEFVRAYYDELRSENYAAGWAQLTPEFIAARNLTFDRYVNYWQATSLVADQLHFTSGPDAGEGRVRFAATYTTSHGVIKETDEITLHLESDGRLTIADQRIVG